MTVLKTLGFDSVGDVMIVVHPFTDVDDADWQMLVAASRALYGKTDKVLVLAGGACPTPAQVAQIAQVVRAGRMRVAVLIERPKLRGVVSALGWTTRRYRGFEGDRVQEALQYLNIAPGNHDAIFRSIDRLGGELARPPRSTHTNRSSH